MRSVVIWIGVLLVAASARMFGQLVDQNKAPNSAGEGISRPLTGGSYPTQIGDGRWGANPNSSSNVIAFDPFRAIRRGRQLFQRKFNRLEGQGAAVGDGFGNIDVDLGRISVLPDGRVDSSGVEGVDADLRVRPFFHHGGTISIREFIVGALKAEMGLSMADDPDLVAAESGPVTTPSGMRLNGLTDAIERPPAEEGDVGTADQRTALVDFLEFYLLNYFRPATGEQTAAVALGKRLFQLVGCATCHVPDLVIGRDRRVADVETVFDGNRGSFNRLFATARLLLGNPSSVGQEAVAKVPALQPFVVKNIYADFKRHDLGSSFHERNYDGTIRSHFLTTPLWGVATTAPYGHDGRSISLTEVILRHHGEAQAARDAFERLSTPNRDAVIAFLGSLVLFPPDDTASNLDPADPAAPAFPQFRHGSIKLTVLFNRPSIVE